MTRTILLLILIFSIHATVHAGRVSGTITDSSGKIVPFASVQVKGGNAGVTANSEGRFFLNLKPGTYTLVCQHVNYRREEKNITVGDEELVVDFVLSTRQFVMQEVVIKKGEDPAYEIIRKAIKKRKVYQDELKNFSSEVYTKGQMRMRAVPKRFMGQKIEMTAEDSLNLKMLYLSETIARYSVSGKKSRIDVVATQVSGQRDAFGLSTPRIFSFYDNNISIGNLSLRGFISPIADGALNYYRYQYAGSFTEEGMLVSRIRVIPKRKYEPLFSGYINIVEDEWRIHSLQLELTKESQMQLVDTLRIEQLYVPVNNSWVMKTQVLYPAIKFMGFDMYGSFVNVYSDYNLSPVFAKDHFNNTILKYTDSSNKKPQDYWNGSRPIVLQEEEVEDYKRKDSLYQSRMDPHFRDSMQKRANRFSPGSLFLGYRIGNWRNRTAFILPSLLQSVQYNTAEGLVINLAPSWSKRLDTSAGGRRIELTPTLRYGFSNHHFNAWLLGRYTYGKQRNGSLEVSGGKNVFQFNNANPIDPFANTISSLQYERNYMKTYEAWFGAATWNRGIADGLDISLGASYQDRMPLENTTDYKWRDRKDISFTPNYPVELTSSNIVRHQAFTATIGLQWQPGTRYIEFPDRRIRLGSRYPVFSIQYTQAIKGLFGGDADYSKWQAAVRDNLNLRMAGTFSYRLEAGGFLSRRQVFLPDYTHFNGNQFKVISSYENSFFMAPYYRYSNVERFYTKLHAEHHFNGLLTNKIPLFKKLNWNLVAGTNTFYVNRRNYYAEVFAGLENIFRILRVDFIQAYEHGQPLRHGVRFGVDGAFSNRR